MGEGGRGWGGRKGVGREEGVGREGGCACVGFECACVFVWYAY